MTPLYVVMRGGKPLSYFLSRKLAEGFALECHRIAPQEYMRCTIEESYISTYGMHPKDAHDLISAVTTAATY